MPKLSDDDRRAIDVILMNGQYNPNSDPSATAIAAAPEALIPRVNAASNLLQLLDAMPVPEVPGDLAQRTMQRIHTAAESPRASDSSEHRLPPPAANDPNIA